MNQIVHQGEGATSLTSGPLTGPKRKLKPIPPVHEILAVVSADLENGVLYWKERSPETANSHPGHIKWWNENMAGKPVATKSAAHGGKTVCLFGKDYYLHRIIFKIAHGIEPPVIDHFDGDRSNNGIGNLRAASDAVNMMNKSLYKNNQCGHANIRIHKGKYSVAFTVNNRRRKFGSYHTLDEAITVREKVKMELGFNPNHGRPA